MRTLKLAANLWGEDYHKPLNVPLAEKPFHYDKTTPARGNSREGGGVIRGEEPQTKISTG